MSIAAVTKITHDCSPVPEPIITSKSKAPFQDHTFKAPVEGTIYYVKVAVVLGLAAVSCEESLIVCVYVCVNLPSGGTNVLPDEVRRSIVRPL